MQRIATCIAQTLKIEIMTDGESKAKVVESPAWLGVPTSEKRKY
jgi:hypothetical protein